MKRILFISILVQFSIWNTSCLKKLNNCKIKSAISSGGYETKFYYDKDGNVESVQKFLNREIELVTDFEYDGDLIVTITKKWSDENTWNAVYRYYHNSDNNIDSMVVVAEKDGRTRAGYLYIPSYSNDRIDGYTRVDRIQDVDLTVKFLDYKNKKYHKEERISYKDGVVINHTITEYEYFDKDSPYFVKNRFPISATDYSKKMLLNRKATNGNGSFLYENSYEFETSGAMITSYEVVSEDDSGNISHFETSIDYDCRLVDK